jgi:hypothetical protein
MFTNAGISVQLFVDFAVQLCQFPRRPLRGLIEALAQGKSRRRGHIGVLPPFNQYMGNPLDRPLRPREGYQ